MQRSVDSADGGDCRCFSGRHDCGWPVVRTEAALADGEWTRQSFLPVFLALGVFCLLPPWIIILPKKLIRWEAAGSGLGQGLCRSWGESGEDVAGEGDLCQPAGGGSLQRGERKRERRLGRAGNAKQDAGGSEGRVPPTPLVLISGQGEE